MRERSPEQLSRREFLGVLGLGVLALSLPRKIQGVGEGVVGDFQTASCGHEEGYPGKDEGVAETGIKIIDNVDIESGGRKVNVVVDEMRVKENILSRAYGMVSSACYPKVERLIDGLVISLGAKPYPEVRMMVEGKNWVHDNDNDNVISKILIDLFGSVPSLFEPEGEYFPGEKPVIYINTGQVLADGGVENLRRVWDHETAHLIYSVDPEKRESQLERALGTAALQTFVSLFLSTFPVFAKYEIIARRKGIDLKTLILGSEKIRNEIAVMLIFNSTFQLLPSLVISRAIRYRYFDRNENLARQAEEKFPTQQEFFDSMIKILDK